MKRGKDCGGKFRVINRDGNRERSKHVPEILEKEPGGQEGERIVNC